MRQPIGVGDVGWGETIAAALLPENIPALAAYEALSSAGSPTAPAPKTDWNTIAIVAGAGLVALIVFGIAASDR
jgi:hypothetical protein